MEEQNSPYYMGNRDCPPTVLILKTGESITKVEMPWDVNGADICHAFYTACIGAGFSPEGIAQSMYEFGETHKKQEDYDEERND